MWLVLRTLCSAAGGLYCPLCLLLPQLCLISGHFCETSWFFRITGPHYSVSCCLRRSSHLRGRGVCTWMGGGSIALISDNRCNMQKKQIVVALTYFTVELKVFFLHELNFGAAVIDFYRERNVCRQQSAETSSVSVREELAELALRCSEHIYTLQT